MAIKFVDKDPEDDKPKKAQKTAKAEVKAEAVAAEGAPTAVSPVSGPKKKGRPSGR